ncbi:hypothetical protein ACERII_23500 [Evansella sp. AB-rgal1]|uniref:hypothetical protein n=1 Tax=Evansella sp. AB-rgal1 TaxID=3242696 RepID=UPI00359F03C1
MERYIQDFMQKLYNNYIKTSVPNNYTLSEIDRIMKDKYRAFEEDSEKADVEWYVEDTYVVRKYYVIHDPKVLEELFTTEEKIDLYTSIQNGKQENVVLENDSERMWNHIEEGRRINVIIESIDNKKISNYTIQGTSEKLWNDIVLFEGIDDDKCYL